MPKRIGYRRHLSDPVEFLTKVLDTWTTFCEVNYSLATAIADLLEENASLRRALEAKEKATRKSRD